MGKNITVSDDAYEFLKKIKGDQSFSEVILSMKGKRTNVMNYAGILSDSDLESVEEIRENMREDWKNRETA